jgi:hypothetical protein
VEQRRVLQLQQDQPRAGAGDADTCGCEDDHRPRSLMRGRRWSCLPPWPRSASRGLRQTGAPPPCGRARDRRELMARAAAYPHSGATRRGEDEEALRAAAKRATKTRPPRRCGGSGGTRARRSKLSR